MYPIAKRRMVLLIVLLLGTAGLNLSLIGHFTEPAENQIQSLHRYLYDIPNFSGLSGVTIDEKIVSELKLDDYLFRSYSADKGPITVYIGYYRTAGKVGAAHDPLVCYQGQGWQISSRGRGRHQVPGGPDWKINYSTMIVARLERKDLLVYWFQTGTRTAADTFRQKIDMIRERLTGGSEINAFVRISIPMGAQTPEMAKRTIIKFIDQFYPRFYKYLRIE